LPDLTGLKVKESWSEIEGRLHRRSSHGWVLLACGLGFYLVVMAVARLLLPPAGLIPTEYLLVHVFLYFPLPLFFVFSEQRQGRAVFPWIAAIILPAVLAALARGGLLNYAGVGAIVHQAGQLARTIVYPLGVGLWITILFGKHWQKSCPRGLADLGLARLDRRRVAIGFGLGLAAALALLLHLYLTMFFSGLAKPAWAGLGAVWAKGGFTLAQESLGEELFYRGFFFQYLRRLDWPFWPAALLVATFDAAHFLFLPGTLGNLAMAVGLVYYVFVYSVVNCALVDRTKSLLPAWTANALFTMLVAALRLQL